MCFFFFSSSANKKIEEFKEEIANMLSISCF